MLLHSVSRFFLLFGLIVIVTACSPHPGAGNWQADSDNALKISRINVVFEGTADFFTNGREDSIRRCFWAAIGKQSLQFQCVQSDNTDIKETYQFFVSPTGKAELKRNEQLIASFTKQAYQAANEASKKTQPHTEPK